MPPPSAAQPEVSPQDLYERVAPSVVTVIARDENGEPIYSGSGFFLDKSMLNGRDDGLEKDERLAKSADADGRTQGAYVLTNFHVIRPAVSAELVLDNGDVGHVRYIIAEDEAADLALLFVTVPVNVVVSGIPLAPSDPRVMATVYAIGSPEGLRGTASEGEVSAYRKRDGHDCLQITVPVSHGSSGGPLLLPDGALAGVTTWTFGEGQNLNFAIPASAVRSFLDAAELRPRYVFEGASIRLQEHLAFVEMDRAVESKHPTVAEPNIFAQWLPGAGDNDPEKRAVATLSGAWRDLRTTPASDGDSLARYQTIIALAQGTEDSLADEFKYLIHYVVGKASLCAATQAGPQDANDAAPTEESRIRYRESRYAAEARDHLAKAIELKPEFSPAYEQVYQHQRLSGNWADALLTADRLVKIMPRCAEALALRAEGYRMLGQPVSARHDLEAASQLSPADGELHYQLATILTELGEYQKAVEVYESALACDTPGIHSKAHYHLGLAYRKSGNVEKAFAEFTTAKALGWPDDVCDRQIAECGQHAVAPTATLNAARSTLQDDQITVYITKTGNKYHRDGCEYLKESKIPISLTDAARMYEPCTHCHPPVLKDAEPDSAGDGATQNVGLD